MRKESHSLPIQQLSFGSVGKDGLTPIVLTTISLVTFGLIFLKPSVLPAKADDPICQPARVINIGNRSYSVTSCLINRPSVNTEKSFYSNQELSGLAVNTVVKVEADGCVQTGGSGKTWKRYVNPYPDPNFYYGTISIPQATNGFIPIRDAIDKNWRVGPYPGRTVSEQTSKIGLGYVDSNYGDNGYYKHDNGNNDQCENVGDAWVRLTIYHPMY